MNSRTEEPERVRTPPSGEPLTPKAMQFISIPSTSTLADSSFDANSTRSASPADFPSNPPTSIFGRFVKAFSTKAIPKNDESDLTLRTTATFDFDDLPSSKVCSAPMSTAGQMSEPPSTGSPSVSRESKEKVELDMDNPMHKRYQIFLMLTNLNKI